MRPVNVRLVLAVRGRTLLAIFGILFLAVAGCGFFGLFTAEKVIPEQLFAQAVQKTLASKSFRYQVEVKTENQGVLSQVEGAWVSPDRVHLQGQMYKTPVEFIQVGETTYLKDIWTKKWLALEGNRLGQAQLYVCELAPLNFLNFKNVFDLRFCGREKTAEGKALVLECRPQLQEFLVKEKDREYRGRVWIDAKDRRVRQVLLQPAEPGAKNLPTVMVRFWDYDRDITIAPPVKS